MEEEKKNTKWIWMIIIIILVGALFVLFIKYQGLKEKTDQDLEGKNKELDEANEEIELLNRNLNLPFPDDKKLEEALEYFDCFKNCPVDKMEGSGMLISEACMNSCGELFKSGMLALSDIFESDNKYNFSKEKEDEKRALSFSLACISGCSAHNGTIVYLLEYSCFQECLK